MRWIALALLLAGCSSRAPEFRATQTGDIIGTATMADDRVIQMELVSFGCDGMIAHGRIAVPPSDPRYAEYLQHLGGLEPGQTKPVPAWPTPPCP